MPETPRTRFTRTVNNLLRIGKVKWDQSRRSVVGLPSTVRVVSLVLIGAIHLGIGLSIPLAISHMRVQGMGISTAYLTLDGLLALHGVRTVFQHSSALSIRPYLYLPVSRSTIAAHILVDSLTDLFNLLAYTSVLGIWIAGIYTNTLPYRWGVLVFCGVAVSNCIHLVSVAGVDAQSSAIWRAFVFCALALYWTTEISTAGRLLSHQIFSVNVAANILLLALTVVGMWCSLTLLRHRLYLRLNSGQSGSGDLRLSRGASLHQVISELRRKETAPTVRLISLTLRMFSRSKRLQKQIWGITLPWAYSLTYPILFSTPTNALISDGLEASISIFLVSIVPLTVLSLSTSLHSTHFDILMTRMSPYRFFYSNLFFSWFTCFFLSLLSITVYLSTISAPSRMFL